MLQWIDFVAIAVVAVLFVLAVRHTVKRRKNGNCCGGTVKIMVVAVVAAVPDLLLLFAAK